MAARMTPSEIRERGLRALVKELGPDGYVRFLQEMRVARGDYTKERFSWLGEKSVQEIAAEMEKRPSKGRGAKKRAEGR